MNITINNYIVKIANAHAKQAYKKNKYHIYEHPNFFDSFKKLLNLSVSNSYKIWIGTSHLHMRTIWFLAWDIWHLNNTKNVPDI